jgi:hypothetical protein
MDAETGRRGAGKMVDLREWIAREERNCHGLGLEIVDQFRRLTGGRERPADADWREESVQL